MDPIVWWVDYEVGLAQWARWRIGPLELFAQATAGEWVFAWKSGDDPLDGSFAVDVPTDATPAEDIFSFGRCTTEFDSASLRLSPRLADRAFVVRPELPLFLPAGEKTTLYVSSPVWVSGYSTDARQTRYFEVPSFRPSDTWFGRNTCEGELCYAARTHARTKLSSLTVRANRAVTPLEIHNNGGDNLPIDQLRVPLPALSLFQDDRGQLWTDTVSLIRDEDETSAAMTLSETTRLDSDGKVLLAEPREPIESGTIISVFSKLLD